MSAINSHLAMTFRVCTNEPILQLDLATACNKDAKSVTSIERLKRRTLLLSYHIISQTCNEFNKDPHPLPCCLLVNTTNLDILFQPSFFWVMKEKEQCPEQMFRSCSHRKMMIVHDHFPYLTRNESTGTKVIPILLSETFF